jgi:pimeloyl-ACP methyl ester carboxylesterase
MVPDVPRFQAQQVAAGDGALLADAVRFLLAQPEGRGPVGLAAISYAVGPAFLAALEPDLRARIGFIVAIGGYYDAEAVVTFFTTGYFRDSESAPWHKGRPNEYGKWVFVQANAERVERAYDRVALMAMSGRKLANPNSDVSDLTLGLGPEGQAVVALLSNADPDRVPALIAALPPAVRDDLYRLNLAIQDLKTLTARVLLIHGRDDAIVPYTESVALARALPEGSTHLALLDNLAHADLGPGGIVDAMRLWWAAYALMQVRR